jgi:hypothetical protein
MMTTLALIAVAASLPTPAIVHAEGGRDRHGSRSYNQAHHIEARSSSAGPSWGSTPDSLTTGPTSWSSRTAAWPAAAVEAAGRPCAADRSPGRAAALLDPAKDAAHVRVHAPGQRPSDASAKKGAPHDPRMTAVRDGVCRSGQRASPRLGSTSKAQGGTVARADSRGRFC